MVVFCGFYLFDLVCVGLCGWTLKILLLLLGLVGVLFSSLFLQVVIRIVFIINLYLDYKHNNTQEMYQDI